MLRLGRWTEIINQRIEVALPPRDDRGRNGHPLSIWPKSKKRAQWRWLSWGASTATVVWLVSSWAFSYYLQNFADYNATYGTLGAMIGFMMWTWISVIILLVGAELNAELEHQTAKDTTTGAPEPMGKRGAYRGGHPWPRPRTVVARGGSGPPINPAVGVAPVYPEPIAWCRPVPARPSA